MTDFTYNATNMLDQPIRTRDEQRTAAAAHVRRVCPDDARDMLEALGLEGQS